MQKKYTSLGLMSGTSGDGVDASFINSDGINQLEVIKDKYFEYDSSIYKQIHSLKEKIFDFHSLIELDNELKDLERKITLFHAKIIKNFKIDTNDFLVGFHGQTIYHNPEKKISKQLGDGKLLYQLTKKKIIYDFRSNDINNGGEGAPLTPIYHQLIAAKQEIKLPVCFLNIGGISNITIVKKSPQLFDLESRDLGPGNCLIDMWVRKNTNKKYDFDGRFASSGKINQIILEQAQELYNNRINKEKKSFDTNDFDISFSRGLSVEDGAATLTEFTASVIAESLFSIINKESEVKKILLCGGGRKNTNLINSIIQKLPSKIKFQMIDDYKVSGDFIESQAFAFLAIRSIKNLPISFPSTTGCIKPSTGGILIKN